MDYSTTALEVCWWNHPVIVLSVLAWAVARGSAAVAGEIERGTIDVTLSRPVPRWSYLTSQIVFTLLGLLAMTASLVLGSLVASLFYSLKAPSLATLAKPAAMLVTVGWPFSATRFPSRHSTLFAGGPRLSARPSPWPASSPCRSPDSSRATRFTT